MKRAASDHGWKTLLQKWLDGEATHTDEAELEVQARSDEFLAEAFEGYREAADEDHLLRLERIRSRLPRQRRRRSLLAYLPPVAAALMLAIGAWWAYQQAFAPSEMAAKSENSERLSLQRESRPEASHALSEQPQSMPNDSSERAESTTAQPQTDISSSESASSTGAPAPANQQPSQTAAVERAATTDRTQPEVPTAALLPPPVPALADENPAKKLQQVLDTASAGETSQVALVTGKVLDADTGQPLIGATILAVGTDHGTITNIDGSFSFPLPDGVHTIEVSYTGYEKNKLDVQPGTPVTVRLRPSAESLDEVAITASGKKRTPRNSNELAPPNAQPAPEGGWDRWQRHLRRNLRYPELARQAGVKGTVQLQFEIDDQGRPTQIKVIKSLGFGCDTEAIRLLRTGPRWKPPGTATVEIPFGQ